MSDGVSATGFEALLDEKSFLLADGATGTNLFAMGLESGEAPEAWILEHPDRVQALHQSFVDAGSDLFLTNTFGGTRHRLSLHGLDDQVGSLNRRAAQLAREVADKSGRRVLVAGSVGPTGEILAPLGKLERADAVASFAEQIEGLVEGGIDLVWIETISAPDELEAAVEAARAYAFAGERANQYSGFISTWEGEPGNPSPLGVLVNYNGGAEARKVMGMTVFSGMLAATVIGVLVVPAMFVFVEKYISKREAGAGG